MYTQSRSEVLDSILKKIKSGRTITRIRVIDLSLNEQSLLKLELEHSGLHYQIEEEILTAWAS